jgi:hypothetical protein
MKKEENKYFTPKIEDFKIGYEYEFQGIPKGWHKMIFSENDSLKTMKYNIEELSDAIRVPYLTKKAIKAKECMKNYRFLKFNFDKKLNKLTMYKYSEDKFGETIFKGECKSINEFRYVCKLLKIE